ncbi:MAG: PilC/PilY family type IV pilus protein [Moraxella sp.]|nr:PilC/PilY family type IV pilus protein [Moraxella sp.]
MTIKKFTTRHLSYAISTVLALSVAQQATAADYQSIGDLEIYEPARGESGSATLTMMLDISGSMLWTHKDRVNYIIDNNDNIGCNYRSNGFWAEWDKQIEKQIQLDVTDTDGNKVDSIKFNVYACQDNLNPPRGAAAPSVDIQNNNGVVSIITTNAVPTRLSSLKVGLISYLADGKKIREQDKIGVGVFPVTRVRGGAMGVPSKSLTHAHRMELIKYIANLRAAGNTPTATAYAEVGAYMIGTRPAHLADINSYTGFTSSPSSTKVADSSRYQSPIDLDKSPAQCSGEGYGIFFLTDGEPNTSVANRTVEVMNTSLARPLDRAGQGPVLSGATGLSGGSRDGGWNLIGEYAKILSDKTKNPLKVEIRTATVGFGDVFAGFATRQIMATQPDGTQKTEIIPDCNTRGISQDAKNLCLWGEREGSYGKGGFTSTGDAVALSEAVRKFALSLQPESKLSSSPAGTISIPVDPLSTGGLQPYAYTPMLQPELEQATATWQGNLKKYHTVNGTLFGNNNNGATTRLYITKNGSTFPYAVNPEATDIWQTGAPLADNSAITTGGTFPRIVMPTTASRTSRTVYVEDMVMDNNGRSRQVLVRVGVDDKGALIGFNQLSSSYSVIDKAYILHFLGYGAVSVDETQYGVLTGRTDNEKLQNQITSGQPTSTRVLGGVNHSVPALAAYQGRFDRTGNISTTEGRDDYVLYGSMDGALHMADADNGDELFSFIPRGMFDNHAQRAALSPTGQGIAGNPVFGVDAPWRLKTRYTYDYARGRVSLKAVAKSDVSDAQPAGHMYAYGGLRMGGNGLYGLNITDKTNPSMLFALTNTTAGFGRMGQIWSKPSVATIKVGRTNRDTREVLIFGGGYDMCYENPTFRLNDTTAGTCAKSQAQGNAVYMVDAATGELLTSWTISSDVKKGSAHMNHSIVGEIVTLDRNSNGYIDHLYFADLGGQVFRIDLQEGVQPANATRRVVRVFDANGGINDNSHIPFRFYDAPVVSFYGRGANSFALLNIASGDRSSPVHKRRTLADSNRLYGIFDRDITHTRVTNSKTTPADLRSSNLNNTHLTNLDVPARSGTEIQRDALIEDVQDTSGWYYHITGFNGRDDITNLKSLGAGRVLGYTYYSSIYNADYQYGSADQCSAKVVGGTEYQMYCLPWGVCTTNNAYEGSVDTATTDGTLGYLPAGPGIRELAITSFTTTANVGTRVTTLLGLQSIGERNDWARQHNITNTGATHMQNNSGVDDPNKYLNYPDFIDNGWRMRVNRWYDLQGEE